MSAGASNDQIRDALNSRSAGGSWRDSDQDLVQCPRCNGPGRAWDPDSEGVPSPCGNCRGEGLVARWHALANPTGARSGWPSR